MGLPFLHQAMAPEGYIGGPLALLRTGDIVRLDLPARRLAMRGAAGIGALDMPA